jgi:hypothetical protein
MNNTIYIPKGEMCMNCRHQLGFCNEFPFDTYPKVGQFVENDNHYTIVICKNYEPK